MADKKWTKEDIKAMLENNPNAVKKGLVTIYKLQTADERETRTTRHENGVGFTGADAEFMTGLAKQFLAKGYLTEKQFACVKKNMMKYAGQLAKVANGQIVVPDLADVPVYKAPVPKPQRERFWRLTDGNGKVEWCKADNIRMVEAEAKRRFPNTYYGGSVVEVDKDTRQQLDTGDFCYFAVKEAYGDYRSVVNG